MRESILIKELDIFFDDLDKGVNYCRYVNIIVIGVWVIKEILYNCLLFFFLMFL